MYHVSGQGKVSRSNFFQLDTECFALSFRSLFGFNQSSGRFNSIYSSPSSDGTGGGGTSSPLSSLSLSLIMYHSCWPQMSAYSSLESPKTLTSSGFSRIGQVFASVTSS